MPFIEIPTSNNNDVCFNLIGVYFCELILILCIDNVEGAQCAGVSSYGQNTIKFWRCVFPTVWSITLA